MRALLILTAALVITGATIPPLRAIAQDEKKPETIRFFVTGEVTNPGAFEWTSGVNVRQALALAGGVTKSGSVQRITIARTVNGERVSVRATMDDVVLADDTVVVSARYF